MAFIMYTSNRLIYNKTSFIITKNKKIFMTIFQQSILQKGNIVIINIDKKI